MTTPLTKPVAREIPSLGPRHDPRSLVVTLTVFGVEFRVKGTRTTYLLPYGVAFQRAAQLMADRDVRMKRTCRVSRGLLATEAANG